MAKKTVVTTYKSNVDKSNVAPKKHIKKYCGVNIVRGLVTVTF